MLFAASFGATCCLGPGRAGAQNVPAARPVPGRALLDFPLGTLAEVPALATGGGGGFTNPAALLADGAAEPPSRLRVAVGQLSAQGLRGATGQFASLNTVRGRSAIGVSFARMGVDGIDRTGDGGPQVIGDVRYDTYVLSAESARRLGGTLRNRVVVGVAARYRGARDDTLSASTAAVDVGLLADGLFGARDVRLAASSFLWRPGRESIERPGARFGADAHVLGTDAAHEVRAGVSHDVTRGATSETGIFAAGRWTYAESRIGIASARGFGDSQTRFRLALAFRADRLTVGVAHEGSAPSFGSLWQFTLSSRLR